MYLDTEDVCWSDSPSLIRCCCSSLLTAAAFFWIGITQSPTQIFVFSPSTPLYKTRKTPIHL